MQSESDFVEIGAKLAKQVAPYGQSRVHQQRCVQENYSPSDTQIEWSTASIILIKPFENFECLNLRRKSEGNAAEFQ
ncbi:hypothetical protein FGO68_gene6825 [Halteria grandinella]|uniref:Uncharacterized protein n=1 Tax=Halteria grandinella TaxID=5974 RepID=A0A8J8SVE6_HALGN|nr:hypothetical protein FGO68_gene6825 [Halteria grandinella]